MQSVVALYSGREDLASDVCVRNVLCSSTADTRDSSDWNSVTVFPRQNDQEICLPVYIYIYV